MTANYPPPIALLEPEITAVSDHIADGSDDDIVAIRLGGYVQLQGTLAELDAFAAQLSAALAGVRAVRDRSGVA